MPLICKALILTLFLTGTLHSQNLLRLSYPGLFKTKVYSFYEGDILEFRVRGKWGFEKRKILAMGDNQLHFSDESVLALHEVGAVRLRKEHFWIDVLKRRFIIAGIGFITLNTLNDLIIDDKLGLEPRALRISGAFFAVAVLLREANIKRIRIGPKKSFRIIGMDYRDLE